MAVTYNPIEEKLVIGKFFRYKRKLKGLTIHETAALVDRTQPWLRCIEIGKNRIYLDDAIKLCHVLDTDLIELTNFVNENI